MQNTARLQLCSILATVLIFVAVAFSDAAGNQLTASQQKKLHDTFVRTFKIQRALHQSPRSVRLKNRAPAALISGTVINSADSQPIGNATIFIFDTAPNLVGSGMTDSSGNYAVDVPTGGPYYVVAVADPFIDEAYDNIPCEGGSCDITSATLVSAPSSTIDFSLDPTGGGGSGNSISGTVTEDGTGTPLQATAYLYEINTGSSYTVDADVNGLYTIQDFPDGSYVIAVFLEPEYVPEVYDNIPCPGGICDLTGATLFDFTGSNTQFVNIDFGLSHYAAIEGDITVNSGSAPLTDLTAIDIATDNQYYGQSDVDGHYRISGLIVGDFHVVAVPTGNYIAELYDNIRCPNGICDFSTGTPVSVTSGQTTLNINFALDTGGRIEGFVTSNSGPVEFEMVYIPELDSGGLSEVDGHYQIEGLPSGNYKLLTFGDGMFVDELYDNIPCPGRYCDISVGNLVSVTEGATTNINVALSDGGKIQGDVFIMGGPPMGELFMFFYNSTGELTGFTAPMGDSYFQSSALPPGNYFLRTDDALDVAAELYDNILCPAGLCNILSGTPITVNANQITSGIAIDLDLCSGGLSMNTASLPDGATGTNYAAAFSVSGTAPFTFGIASGSLPPGITLSTSGALSGVPTSAGDYTFTVAVSTGGSCGGKFEFTIHVSQPLCLFCDEFEDGTLSADWTFNKGTWNEDGHNLVGTFTGKAQALATPGFTGCVTCTVQATVRTDGGSVSVLGWYKDKKNLLELMMKQPSNKWILKYKQNGTMIAKMKFTQTLSANVDYDVEISFASGSFVVMVDGATIMTVPVPADPQSGTAGLQVKKATGTFDRISIN